eukprot:NODE_1849_length_715_cov_58.700680_g1799_i0.p1 GENE.NODE_1849_length_715_cov_58.700680_g1799_i0~~NODE_1849_length_715_cov_58.700680_g1799_i0.p1  ORF type:complete len:138 (-),score=11.22 NODE_1849_length_715_cov_58.700680_g1799_i0:233-646(-)
MALLQHTRRAMTPHLLRQCVRLEQISLYQAPITATIHQPSRLSQRPFGTNSTKQKENVFTIPNVLSLGRILATPVIGYFIVQHNFPVASTMFVVAGITDFLDGYIARNFDQKTVFGAALDPMADKLFVITIHLQAIL